MPMTHSVGDERGVSQYKEGKVGADPFGGGCGKVELARREPTGDPTYPGKRERTNQGTPRKDHLPPMNRASGVQPTCLTIIALI